MEEWLWYIRSSDKSIFYTPKPPPDATLVSAPPDPKAFTWDWVNGGWIEDTTDLLMRAKLKVEDELIGRAHV